MATTLEKSEENLHPAPFRNGPDPSVMTTAQLYREIGNLETRLKTRIDAMDVAASLLHEDFVRVPTLLDKTSMNLREFLLGEIKKLEAVSAERFVRIDNQFVERDKRAEQLALASATAIAAALQAQKEAVAEQNKSSALAISKSEASVAESIRQLQTLFNAAIDAANAKIDDVKSRLDKGEGRTRGFGDFVGWIMAAGGLIVAAIAIFFK